MKGDKLQIVKTSNADVPITDGLVSGGGSKGRVGGEGRRIHIHSLSVREHTYSSCKQNPHTFPTPSPPPFLPSSLPP